MRKDAEISQGSVVMCLSCGGIFIDKFYKSVAES